MLIITIQFNNESINFGNLADLYRYMQEEHMKKVSITNVTYCFTPVALCCGVYTLAEIKQTLN